MIQSFLYFILAGFCEIGGGYLVWQWVREGKSVKIACLGWLLLMLYSIMPTLQPENFGRVYAAYGGVFIVLSLLWGWKIDDIRPDHYDWIGAGCAIAGALIMLYAPRS